MQYMYWDGETWVRYDNDDDAVLGESETKTTKAPAPLIPLSTETGKVRISAAAIFKMSFYAFVSGASEVGGFGQAVTGDDGILTIADVRRLDDDAGSGGSESTSLTNAKFLWNIMESGGKPDEWWVNWHTHPSFSPYPSHQDDLNVTRWLVNGTRILDLIVSRIGLATCRLVEKIDNSLNPSPANMRVTRMDIVWSLPHDFMEDFNAINAISARNEKAHQEMVLKAARNVSSAKNAVMHNRGGGARRQHGNNGTDTDGAIVPPISTRLITTIWSAFGGKSGPKLKEIEWALAAVDPLQREDYAACVCTAKRIAVGYSDLAILHSFAHCDDENERRILLRSIADNPLGR